jgi:type IV pilus assembly protein PilB
MSTTDQNIATLADPQSEREKSKRLAERYRCPFVDLLEQRIDPELFRSIPADLMFRFNFVPIDRKSVV